MVQIQFLEDINETSFPIVKLTKSINGKTGTATFLFIRPKVFEVMESQHKAIHSMTLFFDKKEIQTQDISILFKNGKPFLLKSILIFKNSSEWFNFLSFMTLYSKEKGLLFES